ncbi:T9SS type A sorting domain-containing protein [Gelidibacter japonicus]|uniref:T9SS type A sorting domain-containing protein n=1 Tax=Gelidibacter japonicus TaxID=1962232 RepID=UPI00396A35AE
MVFRRQHLCGCASAFKSNSVCLSHQSTPILDDKKFSKITLFPNPTNGNFSLSLGHQAETLNLKIFNMLGQVVLSRSYTSVERVENLSVEDPGIYFIKISNSNGGSQTLRLLVN